ncbi:Fc.00g071540.m01.CDS01 [Cosmosporella sp. VM-42]
MVLEDKYLFELRERCSWPRITKLRHKCLLNSVQAFSNPNHVSPYDKIIQVRLQPYEKHLLADTISLLNSRAPPLNSTGQQISSDAHDYFATLLFFRWSWADSVLRCALAEFSPDSIEETHAGDHTEAFASYSTQLRTRVRGDIYDRRHLRTEQLLADNSGLFRDASRLSDLNITIGPHANDLQLWRALGNVVSSSLAYMQVWPGMKETAKILDPLMKVDAASFAQELQAEISSMIASTPSIPARVISPQLRDEAEAFKLKDLRPDMPKDELQKRIHHWASDSVQLIFEAEDVWDVWIFARIARASVNNAAYLDQLDETVRSEAVSSHWRSFGGILNQRPSSISSEFLSEDLQEYMELEYRRHDHNMPRLDIRAFLEFIPWTQLMDCPVESLSELLDDLGLDTTIFTGAACVASTANPTSHSRIFYASDDLYAPHLMTDYRYPGLFKEDRIIYRCQKVQDTQFFKGLRQYWTLWNDCAITRNPFDSSFYLLETLPGVKARLLEKRSDIGSVLHCFDIKYRYRESLKTQRELLRAILGAEYDPAFSDFLQYINPAEFDISSCSFIGKGSFGRVYGVRWSRMPVEKFDYVEETSGDVVLKIAIAREGPEKFFYELGTVYAALAGDSSGCVKFYGFTQVAIDGTGKPMPFSHNSTDPANQAFALVFDFASEGPVLRVLGRELEPGEPVENWFAICNVLSDVAEGLRTIHKKGVVHRDLHENNVLIQEHHAADCEETEYVALISDLGEGKDMTKLTSPEAEGRAPLPGVFSFEDSLAPEGKFGGSSKEADIYAWAMLAVKMISTSYDTLAEDGHVYFPAKLMRVLEQCLDADPKARFDAKSLCFVMEEIKDGLSGSGYGGDDCEWFDETYELPGARRAPPGRLFSSLSF